MKMPCTVYLGGPMRGYPAFNFDEFFRVGDLLTDRGFTVLNPAVHDVVGGFDPFQYEDTSVIPSTFDFEAALAWDFRAIEKADCVFFLPGWKKSSGSQKEYAHAVKTETPVYELIFDDQRYGPNGYAARYYGEVSPE